jgi:hypothetical protein
MQRGLNLRDRELQFNAGRMRRKILVDWDWAANGVWYIGSNGTTGALFMPDNFMPRDLNGKAVPMRPNPWRERFSPPLRAELLEFNLDGERLWGGRFDEHTDLDAKQAWYARAAELAIRIQDELGPEFEVFHVTPGGAWRWASPPWTDSRPD